MHNIRHDNLIRSVLHRLSETMWAGEQHNHNDEKQHPKTYSKRGGGCGNGGDQHKLSRLEIMRYFIGELSNGGLYIP